MKLFLIGFMGSGKSTIGRLLAEKLSLDFVDLDQVFEEKHGEAIPAFFSEKGEEVFRELEATCLRETGSLQNVVIATGGGAPCYLNNMEWMNENGLTIFLSVPPNVLAHRLEGESLHRPLLRGKSGNILTQFIEEKLKSRMPFYEASQFVCDAKDNAEDIVSGMVGYFARFKN